MSLPVSATSCARILLTSLTALSLTSIAVGRVVAAEEPAAVQPAAAVETAAAEPADAAPPAAPKPAEAMVAGLTWRTDYNAAYRAAKNAKRMLLINFINGNSAAQQSAEQWIAAHPTIQAKLHEIELARLPLETEITVDGKSQRLINFGAFAHMQGGAGFVLIDLKNVGAAHYGYPVNVLPYAGGKYYQWRPSHLSVILDLPAGTLTQRTMIWAVRTHPERPQSTNGEHNSGLANGAAQHASYQASIGVQGHQNFESRYHQLSAASGGSGVSEVVAESWPNQNMIDSCIDCVQSWRHSPGHWRGVAGRHRAFGYDIRRGRNGIWYGTGIFAN